MRRNPFFFNMFWMLISAMVFLLALNSGLNAFYNTIVIGLFYSAVILLINEIAQYSRDRKTRGILRGEYELVEKFEKIEKGLRTEDLTSERKAELRKSGKEAVEGTCYAKFRYGIGPAWTVKLIYHHSGLYTGTIKYPKYWADREESTDARITLKLEDGINTGSGTYSYVERNDYGTYSFQIREQDYNKIIVKYKNEVPSGILEGYEVWQKKSPRSL